MIEFQDGIFVIMEVMGCQVHVIGKAIRPLFADPVTYLVYLFYNRNADVILGLWDTIRLIAPYTTNTCSDKLDINLNWSLLKGNLLGSDFIKELAPGEIVYFTISFHSSLPCNSTIPVHHSIPLNPDAHKYIPAMNHAPTWKNFGTNTD